MSWDAWVRLLDIAVIDIALSGDNAIVIGMAAAALPRGQRHWAILFGGGCAIALRIALTSMATLLMLVPFLAAAGGVVLVWVVYKLLRSDLGEEGEGDGEARRAATFRQAILLIAVADFMMSLDNVIAVAGSAHGSVPLLAAGLLLSMPLLLTTGGFISMLIDRMRWLVWAGAFAISFTAARMVFEDRGIQDRLHPAQPLVLLCSAIAGVAIPAACWGLQLRLAPASRE